jgi:hypothetical protein
MKFQIQFPQCVVPEMTPVDRFGIDETRLQIYLSRHIRVTPEKVGVAEIALNRGAVRRCDKAGLQGADSPVILARLEISVTDGNTGRKIRRIGQGDRLDGLDEEGEERNPDPGDDVFTSRLSRLRRILERPPEGEQAAGLSGPVSGHADKPRRRKAAIVIIPSSWPLPRYRFR